MIEFSLKFYRTKFNGEHNRTLVIVFSAALLSYVMAGVQTQ